MVESTLEIKTGTLAGKKAFGTHWKTASTNVLTLKFESRSATDTSRER